MRKIQFAIVALLGLATAGCVNEPLPPPQPSMQTLGLLRSPDVPSMQTGQFSLAPGLPSSLDKSVTIRSAVLTSPNDGSLAKYLGATLEADLRAAGKLDPNANLVMQGLLTGSTVDAGIADGTASLSAKFSLLKQNKTIFEKEITVDSKWDSSFVGAIAIPAAITQYSALYDKLVAALLVDTDFKAAARALKP